MITDRKDLDLFLAALILRNSNNKILFQETTFQLKFKYDLWGQMRSKINQQSLFVEVKGRVKMDFRAHDLRMIDFIHFKSQYQNLSDLKSEKNPGIWLFLGF